ncbi:MAG TPA: hypothetical protein VGO67_14975 [Verrucomicrobiae bacterium]|jgi:hypothetical protein
MTFEQITTFEQFSGTDAEILQSRLYHPALSTEHRFFKRLPVPQQYWLEALEKQSNRWQHKVYFKDNLNDRRIALLNGYHQAQRLINCMMNRSPYTKSKALARCNLRECPFCTYLKGQDMLKKYGPAWEPGVWHKLVFSIRGGVPLSTFSINGGPGLPKIWDTMRNCIREFAPACDGIVGWEELFVYSFWPVVRLTPHVHVLVRSISEPDPVLLARIIAEHWRREKLICMPDPQLAPMKSEAHFYECLEYVKPIDLLTPYNTGFRQAKATGQLEEFHQDVREFFGAYADQTSVYQVRWGRRLRAHCSSAVTRCPYFYFGDCHGSSGDSIGLDKESRQTLEHQELMRARQQKAQEQEEADNEDDGKKHD